MANKVLLHEGGEACIYGLLNEKSNLVLKQYKEGVCVDSELLKKISAFKIEGVYKVRESGSRDGTPYVLYDHVDGVASSELETMPVTIALLALRRVARTLGELEQLDVHHGDLSPSNVVISCGTDSFETTLIDFGIVGPGTLSYAAPERFRGKSPDTKSDLYGLGMLLYRWISGGELIATDECSFDEIASRMVCVDQLNLAEQLYGTGRFNAQELSALESLWKGLLRGNPEDRFEDFEELDEVLEIALGSVCGGEISVIKQEQEFANGTLKAFIEKMRQNVPAPDECRGESVVFDKNALGMGKKFPLKISVLCVFGLILLIVLVIFAYGTKDPDIDDMGDLVLQKSRSLESAPEMDVKTENAAGKILLDSSLLKDLPTPERDP